MNLDWNFFEEHFPLAMASLKNARSAGRLTHAFLLCSSNAEYRTAFPPLLASLAACEHPNEDFSPCGRCAVCREMADGTFPDLITLAPSSLSRIIPIGERERLSQNTRGTAAEVHVPPDDLPSGGAPADHPLPLPDHSAHRQPLPVLVPEFRTSSADSAQAGV